MLTWIPGLPLVSRFAVLSVPGTADTSTTSRGYEPKRYALSFLVGLFRDLTNTENLLRGIYAYGYESPSAVQSRAIVQICKGRDTIAQAQSGTGKTATFSISMLQIIDTPVRETQGEPPFPSMWLRL